jgi:predicted MPP superfamily phosphohydrolase
MIGILTLLCWLTAEVYSIGFGTNLATTHLLRILSFIFSGIFIFIFISPRILAKKYLQTISPVLNTLVGIMFYFFIGSIVLGLILGLINLSLKESVIVSIIVSLTSLLFGVLGIIQAKIFKITEYEVFLEGAPKSWNDKKAVLVSDTHFGLINHKNFSDKIVNNILKLQPDFVLHAGDFYDGPKNDTALITDSWKKLTREVPVFYTSGNHEAYGDYQVFIDSIANAGISVVNNTVLEYEGVQIAGITYNGKSENEKAHKALESLAADPIRPLILINHPPTFHDSAISIGTNLMVSGHTHKGQFWPNTYITQIIYKKYFYGLQKKQNLTAITTSGVGTAGPPMRLFNTPEIVVIKFTTKQA